MTITDAVKAVLSDASKPMTATEVRDEIVRRNLFQFNSSASASIVRTQIRRHCEGEETSKSAAGKKYFRRVAGDRFELLRR